MCFLLNRILSRSFFFHHNIYVYQKYIQKFWISKKVIIFIRICKINIVKYSEIKGSVVIWDKTTLTSCELFLLPSLHIPHSLSSPQYRYTAPINHRLHLLLSTHLFLCTTNLFLFFLLPSTQYPCHHFHLILKHSRDHKHHKHRSDPSC